MAIVRPHRGLKIPDFSSGMTYTIGQRLGEGGFGWTFYCENSFGQPLVAKVLKPRGKPRSEIREEWEQELELLTMLRHPNIIHLYDAFEYGALYYFILERAEGTLSSLIRSHGPLSEWEVVELGRQILSGLHYVHSNRVIHRDVHIDNILYLGSTPPRTFKLSDFGISRLIHDSDRTARAYSDVGRDFDVAPELYQLGYTSFQSDLYQVGLALYYCLTGTPALGRADGEPEQAILSGIARKRAKSLGTPLGDCIAVFLRRKSEYRFKAAIEAWSRLKSTRPGGR
jgi:serine/threonine protein kinase